VRTKLAAKLFGSLITFAKEPANIDLLVIMQKLSKNQLF